MVFEDFLMLFNLNLDLFQFLKKTKTGFTRNCSQDFEIIISKVMIMHMEHLGVSTFYKIFMKFS